LTTTGPWHRQSVDFRFQIADWTLFRVSTPMQVKQIPLTGHVLPAEVLAPPPDRLEPEAQGFLVRSLPLAREQPTVSGVGTYICYVRSQYRRFFVDMSGTFEEYKAKFSSKTRSTMTRKVTKLRKALGPAFHWKRYARPDEMQEFFRYGRSVSALSYQERLFDAGLPGSEQFLASLHRLAGEDLVRAFVLFDGDRPISYLYCPVEDGVLIYAYLGYDPAYRRLSVGSVLQWLALESLFEEKRFSYFDFTAGQGEHKRLFSTGNVLAADVCFLRRTLRNRILVRAQVAFDGVVTALSRLAHKAGLKARMKALVRFGTSGSAAAQDTKDGG
jgi:CelD/BcsL family acetyltransferase involved in cellulose biosynthesis